MEIKMPSEERLCFSIDEAACAANISRDLLYKEIGKGSPKVKALGYRTLVPRRELERFIDDLPVLDLNRPTKRGRPRKKTRAAA